MEKSQKKELVPKKAGEPGLFIVFEGIDGCGKSTQVELLAKKLRRRGKKALTLSEPTAGRWGQKIRESALDKDSLSPVEELELLSKTGKKILRITSDRLCNPARSSSSTVISILLWLIKEQGD